MGQVFLRVLRFSSVNVSPSVPHITYSFTVILHNLEMCSVVKKNKEEEELSLQQADDSSTQYRLPF